MKHPGKPRATPKSGVVIPKTLTWKGKVASYFLYLLLRTYLNTLRISVNDTSGALKPRADQPYVFALWHNRLFLAMAGWDYVKRHCPSNGLAAIISASGDGAVLAGALGHFDVTAVRGSSSRRGRQALLEALTHLEGGRHVAITPDGPRGPVYESQDGVLTVAQLSGAAIIPVTVDIPKHITLRSWDGFQVPWPFSRCVMTFNPPIRVGRKIPAEDRDQIRRRISELMKSPEERGENR